MTSPGFFPALHAATADDELLRQPSALALYYHLVSTLDFTQARRVKVWSIAGRLHMKRDTVREALGLLLLRGYLAEHARDVDNVRRMTLVWSFPAEEVGRLPAGPHSTAA